MGNTDRNTKIENKFKSSIRARAIRIIVEDFNGKPCARIGATYLSDNFSSIN
jgi:hypothetical protein